MKRMIGILLLCAITMMACADPKQICWEPDDCMLVAPTGVIDGRRGDVTYDLNVDGIILAVVLGPSVIIPCIIGGWYLWEPIGATKERKVPIRKAK